MVDPLAGDWSCRSGHEAGLRLTDDDAMTAVFVVNDDMAIGLVWALHERGRRVPDEVSVVGMDDIPAARFQQPALTTVVHDFDAVATEGVGLLLEEITSPSTVERVLYEVSPPLVVRESSAAPKAET